MSDHTIGFRLSPQQKRLYQLQERFGVTLDVRGVVHLYGQVDSEALRIAVETIVNRHEILRTTFCRHTETREPLQLVHERMNMAWETVRFPWHNRAAQARGIQDSIARQNLLRFDVQKGPVTRFVHLSVAAREGILLIALPALCGDGPTLRIIVAEIAAAYSAVLGKTELGLTDTHLQFADIAEWQNQALESAEWNPPASLRNSQSLLDLPLVRLPFEVTTSSPLPPRMGQTGSTFSQDCLVRIDELASRLKTTAELILQACWYAVLGRMINPSALVVGTVLEGRSFEQLERVLGPLGTAVPITWHYRDDLSFSGLVGHLAEAVEEATRWQDRYYVLRDSPGPVLPLGFAFHKCPAGIAAGDVTFSIQTVSAGPEPFKLYLSCTRGKGLFASLHYDAERYREDDAKRMVEIFRALLANALVQPHTTIGELALVVDREKSCLLEAWNGAKVERPPGKCLHHLFEEQATKTPEHVAIEFGTTSLNYRELDSRANQLAHLLSRHGAVPDSLVAIFLDRSPQMIVALLAVLKSGAAYVPIDPTLPPGRVAVMSDDARPLIWLTEEKYRLCLPASSAPIVSIDGNGVQIHAQSSASPHVMMDPENLAYVIYTSGSTGKPKGVMITHIGLVNYLTWCSREYRVSEGNGSLVHSPLGFDLTVTGLFAPLLTGRRVVLAPLEQSDEAIAAALHEARNFSLVKITPAHLDALGNQFPELDCQSGTNVFVIGGETLNWSTVSSWRRKVPGARFINEYGPTETVVGCCFFEAPKGAFSSPTVPIGRPIDNVDLYVLDDRLEPVPAGVPGELYIGGLALGRGYLNHPDLTAERFIPHPFSALPGQRLYRTGDRVRALHDGNLEFLGRLDDQVKLRGYRIELGDIESALCKHPAVREVAVVVQEAAPGNTRLVACVVSRSGEPIPNNSLREFLKRQLPEYMVPSAFVLLQSLPLTANGKLDRRVLSSVTIARKDLMRTYVAPRNSVERTLAEIWKDVLKVEGAGVEDNFFELGGHSLSATQVISRIRDAFHVQVPLQRIFGTPTIANLALAVVQHMTEGARQEDVSRILTDLDLLSDEEAGNLNSRGTQEM